MEFKDFKVLQQEHMDKMTKETPPLFLTNVKKEDLWNTYLESFPAGTNEIYRENREYDCNCCKSFIRAYGNLVTIEDNKLVSIWDIEDLESPFKTVAKKMSRLVKSAAIRDIFIPESLSLGTDRNFEFADSSVEWQHLFYGLPVSYKRFIDSSVSRNEATGMIRTYKEVFKRSLEELTTESCEVVLELIEQGTLYRGEEFQSAVKMFIDYKKVYDELKEHQRENWCWNNCNNPVSKMRNNAIGQLLQMLSEGMEINAAVDKFEKNIMAPDSYKRPKPKYSPKQVENAKAELKEQGLLGALKRRTASIDDVTVNNVLYLNRDVRKKVTDDIFDEMKQSITMQPKLFKGVVEISIDDFINTILPKTKDLSVLVEQRHSGNFMNLVTSQKKDEKSLFKWKNNFTWSYNGGVADSIKANVKRAGGNVDGVLRFSIQWNDGEHNKNDFDAHCIEPGGNEIYYRMPKHRTTSGFLDIDIQEPIKGTPAVENIAWTNIDAMEEGRYKFFVKNYAHRGSMTGFTAEIECDGQIYSFSYPHNIKKGEEVTVATITFDRVKGMTLLNSLEEINASKEMWGVTTQQFVPVSSVMFSPNHWDDQKTGNKHFFFFLKECQAEDTPRGFLNEYLKEDLMKYKKFFEALGSKVEVETDENQLAGLGFSSTVRNDLYVKVEGAFKRLMKIKF